MASASSNLYGEESGEQEIVGQETVGQDTVGQETVEKQTDVASKSQRRSRRTRRQEKVGQETVGQEIVLQDNHMSSFNQPNQSRPSPPPSSTSNLCTPECQVFYEEADLGRAYRDCEKNPGHEKFIPVKDFKPEHLKEENRTDEIIKGIRDFSDRTVKIKVKYTSHSRPDTYPNSDIPYPYAEFKGSNRKRWCGTGWVREVYRVNKPCPCPKCKESGNPKRKFLGLVVQTAAHVVFDKHEARSTVIELFYDSEEETDGVKIAYGTSVEESLFGFDASDPSKTDKIYLGCVTHDEFSDQEIASLEYDDSLNDSIFSLTQQVIISHPHGQSKKITVGDTLYYELPNLWVPEDKKKNKYERTFNFLSWYSVNTPVTDPHCVETFGHPLEPGRRYELPKGCSLEIPCNAPYWYRVDKDFEGITFPPGTKIWSPDNNHLPLPETTKFHDDGTIGRRLYLMDDVFFSIYDTPTCEGSSGAVIFTGQGNQLMGFYHSHFGHIGDGINHSTLFLSNTDEIFYI